MGFLSDVFQRNKNLKQSYEFNFEGLDVEQRAYLKTMALEVCISFIARTVSMAKFRISENNKRVYDDWDYLLNVRPNTDQSAAEFWQEFAHRTLFKNETLAIVTDSNDLLIVDSFTRTESALYEDVFSDVTIKGFTYNRTFKMSEVIYIKYNNSKLDKFMNGLFEDYTELFSRMIQTAMFSNQIRAIASVDANQSLDEENMAELETFIGKMFNAFKTKVFAIVPKIRGFNYEEITNGTNNGRSIEDITKISDKAVEHVAQLLGVPVTLVRGDMSDYETAIKAYEKFTYGPFLKKISDEFNNKTIDKAEYQKGRRIQVRGIEFQSPLDLLDKADKGVASGIINPDEGREMIGLEPTGLPEMQKYYITKNYQEAEHSEGGENVEDQETV